MAARKRTGILGRDREDATDNRVYLRPRQVERTDIQHFRLITLWSGRYCQARLHLQPRKQLPHLHLPVQGSWECTRPSLCCGNPVLIRTIHLELDKQPLLCCNIPLSTSLLSPVFLFGKKKKASDSVIRPVENCLVLLVFIVLPFGLFGFRIYKICESKVIKSEVIRFAKKDFFLKKKIRPLKESQLILLNT